MNSQQRIGAWVIGAIVLVLGGWYVAVQGTDVAEEFSVQRPVHPMRIGLVPSQPTGLDLYTAHLHDLLPRAALNLQFYSSFRSAGAKYEHLPDTLLALEAQGGINRNRNSTGRRSQRLLVRLLQQGVIDCAALNSMSFLRAVGKQMPLSAVMALGISSNENPNTLLIANSKLNLRQAETWDGITALRQSNDKLADMLLGELAKKAGADPEKINFKRTRAFRNLADPIAKGEIGVALIEPKHENLFIESGNYRVAFPELASLGPVNRTMDVFVCTNDFIRDHPDELETLIGAFKAFVAQKAADPESLPSPTVSRGNNAEEGQPVEQDDASGSDPERKQRRDKRKERREQDNLEPRTEDKKPNPVAVNLLVDGGTPVNTEVLSALAELMIKNNMLDASFQWQDHDNNALADKVAAAQNTAATFNKKP